MKIYIAAPLFSLAEKKQNEEIDNIIRSCGHDTYLPQRDGGCFFDCPEFINGRPKDVVIHEWDISALNQCDAVLFVFDGRVPDEGACFELGYAYAKGKRCFGFKTDTRSLICGVDNLMLTTSLEAIVHSLDELKMLLQSQIVN